MKRNRRTSLLRAWLGAATLLSAAYAATGCSTVQQPAFSNTVEFETVDSPNAHISTVRTHRVDDAIGVTGYVEKRLYRGGMIPGSLLIEAIGSEGNVLAQTEAGYHRRFARSNRAYFSETLPIDPDDVRIVRVTHLGLGQ